MRFPGKSLIAKAWGSITPRISPWYGVIQEPFVGAWQRNMEILPSETLLSFSAVYACITRIADDISPLQLMLMAEQDDGVWDEVRRGSPFLTVLRKPNRYQTRIQFLHQWLTLVLMHGNNYVYIDRDLRGVPVALYNLDPRTVRPLVAPDGQVFYQLQQDNLTGITETQIAVPASEIIHDRMIAPWHPLCGISPLYASARSATQGTNIQTNSNKFFENMSRPGGHLTAPGIITDETASRLERTFQEKFSGGNLGRLLVTGDGIKYEAMTIPAQAAQLIEQFRFTVEDVARAFHVPLWMINADKDPQRSLGEIRQDYYMRALRKRIEDIEILLDEALGLPALGMGVWMDLEGLLRMDPKARAETAEIEVRSASLSPDEARLRENRHPVPGGKTPYLQQQNYSLAALAKRDAKEDPFAKTPAPAPALPQPSEDEEDDEESNLSALTTLAAVLVPKFSKAESRVSKT